MKVHTNVKAGGTSINHNEKMTSNNTNLIEQKKTIGKKLRLSKETIRELRDSDLKVVAGGLPYSESVRHTCTCETYTCGVNCR